MIGNNRKLLAVTALLLAVLLAGCSMEDIPLIGEIFKPAQPQAVGTLPAPETTMPVATMTPQPQATQPVYTESAETEPPVVYYWVRAEGGLNVRSGPGQNYETVGRLDNGARVIPQKWENGWAYITSPFIGWCSGEYLYEEQPDYMGDGTARWTHPDRTLTLYEGPGTDHRVAGYVDGGVKVYPLRWEGNWAYIEIAGFYTGWCRGDHLSEYDPFPDLEMWDLLSARAPADRSLTGNWMVVSDYAEYENTHRSCRAGIIELRSDGTFSHLVYDYMDMYYSGTSSGWHCPGGETSGGDCPYWVGEYTYDGKTLVLNYRAEYETEYIYDETGFPMSVDAHWNRIQKQVKLKVTACEAGIRVDAPQNIPVHTYNAQGSSDTDAILYYADEGGDHFYIPYELLSVYYP